MAELASFSMSPTPGAEHETRGFDSLGRPYVLRDIPAETRDAADDLLAFQRANQELHARAQALMVPPNGERFVFQIPIVEEELSPTASEHSKEAHEKFHANSQEKEHTSLVSQSDGSKMKEPEALGPYGYRRSIRQLQNASLKETTQSQPASSLHAPNELKKRKRTSTQRPTPTSLFEKHRAEEKVQRVILEAKLNIQRMEQGNKSASSNKEDTELQQAIRTVEATVEQDQRASTTNEKSKDRLYFFTNMPDIVIGEECLPIKYRGYLRGTREREHEVERMLSRWALSSNYLLTPHIESRQRNSISVDCALWLANLCVVSESEFALEVVRAVQKANIWPQSRCTGFVSWFERIMQVLGADLSSLSKPTDGEERYLDGWDVDNSVEVVRPKANASYGISDKFPVSMLRNTLYIMAEVLRRMTCSNEEIRNLWRISLRLLVCPVASLFAGDCVGLFVENVLLRACQGFVNLEDWIEYRSELCRDALVCSIDMASSTFLALQLSSFAGQNARSIGLSLSFALLRRWASGPQEAPAAKPCLANWPPTSSECSIGLLASLLASCPTRLDAKVCDFSWLTNLTELISCCIQVPEVDFLKCSADDAQQAGDVELDEAFYTVRLKLAAIRSGIGRLPSAVARKATLRLTSIERFIALWSSS